MRTLNLGILAHVDAGKTSLTERLLHAAGVIDEMGSVDDGTTRTDSLALERRRGITIKSAVVSFIIGDVRINLIDTPGHPDFIAEVERVLNVLDGAVLVISAVEGVQAQTRVLMRALQRLDIPTLIFGNKIDRGGARHEDVLRDIAVKLTPAIIAMGSVHDAGGRAAGFAPHGAADAAFVEELADLLAGQDDALLAAYLDDETSLSWRRLRVALGAQIRQARVYPVFFGSAITGAGVDALMAGITELLPATEGDPEGPVSGTVFKVERGPAGEKVACVRLFSGTVRIRDRLRSGEGSARKVTAIRVFEQGTDRYCASVTAGRIARLWGLDDVRIGDVIGVPQMASTSHHFAPPTLETVVVPRRAADQGVLHAALAQLAEQDPLISLRQDDVRREMFVSLYGEVQKEVIEATLLNDFGIDVEFRGTTTICVERPAGTGRAVEILRDDANPFSATIGLRVDPAPAGSNVDFRLDVDPRRIPRYIYKNTDNFSAAMTRYIRRTLRQGLFGWQVIDCIVTLNECGYYVGDGPAKPTMPTPRTTAADFRHLTPLVLMNALQQAGTRVCEPIHFFSIDMPADALGAVFPVLARLRAVPRPPVLRGAFCLLEGEIPAAQIHALQRELPALTRGEGVLESAFDHYQPVQGVAPTRPRTDPLDREEYLRRVTRRPGGDTRVH